MTQAEADTLLQMSKLFVGAGPVSLSPGVDETHEMVGEDGRERFLLDISRGTIKISKLKYQTRGRVVTVLARLDIDGPPHTNPDGSTLDGTHLHLYREGFESRWAFPVPSSFGNLADPSQAIADFCAYCNINGLPSTQGQLL